MTDMLTPADIAAVTGNKNNNDGWGDGAGAWWMIILFAMIWGWGRGGFGGGNGGNDGVSGGGYVTEAGLCNAMNFNDLANAVGRLGDTQQAQFTQLTNGVCNLGYEIQGLINNNTIANMQGFNGTQMAITQGDNALQMAIMQGDNALQAQFAQCCCETKSAIEATNYNNAMNTAAINANTTAGIQKILDTMCQDKIETLQAKVNQLELNSALCGVVRYPNATTYTAGFSPYWNQGCGCSPYANAI